MPVGSDPRPGSELAGFRLEVLLGRGGMGAVYRAEDLRLGRKVALKLIAPGLAENERFRERFLRESQLAASLDHPHIVPIYAAGEVDGQLFLAMRYVEGSDLKQVLAQEGRLEPARTIQLLDQVADALDAAHSRGLIHRDVKPGNVLIAGGSSREHSYLADFGLTKQTASISGLTGTGELVGTVNYVSPEQIRGEAVDAHADVYALGCVLYECLAGQSPFARESDVATLWAHVNEPPPHIGAARPELGKQIDGVMARALAKTPTERHQSCGELVGSAGAALGVQGPSGQAELLPRAGRLGSRPLLLAAGAAVILVVAAVALALFLRGSDELSRVEPMSVGVIDPETSKLVDDVYVGFTSSLIDAGEGSIWLVNRTGNTLTRINPATKLPQPFGPGSGGMPVALAVGEGSLWIAVNQARTLVVLEIHPEFGTIRRTIPLDEASTASLSVGSDEVELAVGLGSVWALEAGLGRVTRINPATGKPKRLDEGFDAHALAIGGGAVWLGGRTRVTKLDPDTGDVLANPSVPDIAESETMSIAVGAGSVWFTGSSKPTLWRLTLEGDNLASYPLGAAPSAVAVDKGIVWVASRAGRSVTRFDPKTEQGETIELGAAPAGIVAGYGSVWTSPGDPAS